MRSLGITGSAGLARARLRSGFTVVEMMISLGLVLAVIAVVGRFQLSTAGLLTTTSSRGRLNESAMHALESVASELRWAEATSLVVSVQNGSTRLDFQTPVGYAAGNPVWSTVITYQVDAATVDWNGDNVINEGRLVRVQNGKKTVLCDYVIPGGFTAALGGSNVLLQLRLTKMDKKTNRLLRANEQTSISFWN